MLRRVLARSVAANSGSFACMRTQPLAPYGTLQFLNSLEDVSVESVEPMFEEFSESYVPAVVENTAEEGAAAAAAPEEEEELASLGTLMKTLTIAMGPLVFGSMFFGYFMYFC